MTQACDGYVFYLYLNPQSLSKRTGCTEIFNGWGDRGPLWSGLDQAEGVIVIDL